MKSRPRPALRAAVRRSVASESPTGRAMPSRSPEPDGSSVVTTIQSASRRRQRAVRPCDRRRAPPPSGDPRRSACRPVPSWPTANGTSPRSRARRREHRREHVRQVDLGVDLLHDLAVVLDLHVEPIAGERRALLRLRGRRRHACDRGHRLRCRRRGRSRGARPTPWRCRLRGFRPGVRFPLGGFGLFLQLGGAELEPVTMPSIRWFISRRDPLALFRRQVLRLFAWRHDLAVHLAPDRRHVDLDPVLRVDRGHRLPHGVRAIAVTRGGGAGGAPTGRLAAAAAPGGVAGGGGPWRRRSRRRNRRRGGVAVGGAIVRRRRTIAARRTRSGPCAGTGAADPNRDPVVSACCPVRLPVVPGAPAASGPGRGDRPCRPPLAALQLDVVEKHRGFAERVGDWSCR